MTLMLIGLLLFFAIHVTTATPPLRARFAGRIGGNPWRGVVSLFAVSGLVLVGIGWSSAPTTPLFAPQAWARQMAPALVSLALILFVIGAGNFKGYVGRYLHHPMLIGVLIWSSVHLLGNGGLRETVLFGSFLVFTLYALVVLLAAGKRNSFAPALKWDAVGAGIGILVAVAAIHAHGWLFGVPAY